MKPREVLSITFTLSIVVASAAAADSRHESPEGTAQLPALPLEESLGPAAAPATAMAEHPAHAGGPFVGGAAATMSFEDAVRATREIEPESGPRFHIHGQFLQEQPLDPSREAPGPRGPVLASEPPAGEADLLPSAPGDQVAQFDGLADTGSITPNTSIATGPNHVVEAVNSGFAVYSKTGTVSQGYTTFASFFAPVRPPNWQEEFFDPRVLYAGASSRFVMLALSRDTVNFKSYHFIAVSQTSDPTGDWWQWSFSVDAANPEEADSWMDDCGLGADHWGIYVTCNLFHYFGSFKYAQLWSLSPGMLSGGPGFGWVFWDLRWSNDSAAFALQPALPHTTAPDQATFFVNTFPTAGSNVLLWRLTGDRTDSPSLSSVMIGVQGYYAIGRNVEQPGGPTDIDGGDARIMNAVYANRIVYAVLTTDVNNDGRAAGWLTLAFDVDWNTVAWSHLLWTPTTAAMGGFYYFYPAITIDAASLNVAVFGNWTDTETAITAGMVLASGLFKIYTDQPASSDGPLVSFESSLEPYWHPDWGAYSGAAFDWSTGDVWGGVEIAGANSLWRTVLRGMKIADACSADAFEPDDDPWLASSITSGLPQTHNICPVEDEDWVSFTLTELSAVTIETSGPAGDTLLWLHDENLDLIDFDDDSGTELFSRIDRTCDIDPLSPGTYYAKVEEFEGEEITSYNLAYTLVEPCPTCVQDLVLENTTISGSQTFEGKNSVILGPNLVVNGSAVTVVAGQRVVVRSGTAIGGSFIARTDPNVCL